MSFMPATNPWSIYLTLLLGCFITIEAAAFQAPAMPSIAKYFGVNEDITALIVLLYYLGLVVFSPVFGRLADSFGRKRVITSGLVLFAAAEFAAAVAPSYNILLLARFFQGFAVACILPVVLSYVAYLFPPEKRGMPLGVLAFSMSLGATTGGVIGGYMIDFFGWRSIYWVSGGMALVGLAVVAWRTPETPLSDAPYKLDIPGALTLLVSIGSLLSTPTWVSKFGLFSAPALVSLAVGIGGLAALWRIEQKAVAPVVDISILGNRTFLLCGAIYILFLVCHGGSIYSLAFFVNGRPEGTAGQVGLVNTFVFAASMTAGLISGKLIDRVNERSVVVGIIVVMVTGLLLYTTIDIDTALWQIIAIATVLGFAQGMKGPAITKLALATVPNHKMGAGSGIFSMMRDFGTPAGVSVGLALFTAQRTSATQSSLTERASGLGLEPEYLSQLNAGYQLGSIAEYPELGLRLSELGTDYDTLLGTARLDGITSTLPVVGTILIGVITLALVLAYWLPKQAAPVGRAAAAKHVA